MIVNGLIDIAFVIDIIVSFFSAYYDEDFKIRDNFKDIALSYIKSWFFVDLVAVLPFQYLDQSGGDGSGINMYARMGRLSRFYKLLRLIKLLRILKIIKERSKFVKYI